MWKWPGPSGEVKQNWWESTNKDEGNSQLLWWGGSNQELPSFSYPLWPPFPLPSVTQYTFLSWTQWWTEWNTECLPSKHYSVPFQAGGWPRKGLFEPTAYAFKDTLRAQFHWSWLIWNYISQNPLFHIVWAAVERREVGIILPKNVSDEMWRSPERC